VPSPQKLKPQCVSYYARKHVLPSLNVPPRKPILQTAAQNNLEKHIELPNKQNAETSHPENFVDKHFGAAQEKEINVI